MKSQGCLKHQWDSGSSHCMSPTSHLVTGQLIKFDFETGVRSDVLMDNDELSAVLILPL